jgi:hypothetical protein
MSEMPVPTIEPEDLADLRSRAAARLTGVAATKGATPALPMPGRAACPGVVPQTARTR